MPKDEAAFTLPSASTAPGQLAHRLAQRGEAFGFCHRRSWLACAMKLEGIVSKKLTSSYKSGACKSWLKVKNPAYERRTGA
jgi:ATP-dependent DNA ligase